MKKYFIALILVAVMIFSCGCSSFGSDAQPIVDDAMEHMYQNGYSVLAYGYADEPYYHINSNTKTVEYVIPVSETFYSTFVLFETLYPDSSTLDSEILGLYGNEIAVNIYNREELKEIGCQHLIVTLIYEKDRNTKTLWSYDMIADCAVEVD